MPDKPPTGPRKLYQIPIDELSPGEAALSAEKIVEYRQALERGQQLDPVQVYNIDGGWVVRDGNNRVRAYLEHCRANGIPVSNISCTLSTAPPPDDAALDALHKASQYYGKGADAFMRMEVAQSADYKTTQACVARRIFQNDLTHRS